MNRTLFLSVLIFSFVKIQAQDKILYGFGLGQFKEAVHNEFKSPFKTGSYGDGSQYEIYLLNPDKSAYIVFEYSPLFPDTVWSVQVSGKDSTVDLGFKGLRLGDDKNKVIELLGNPDHITPLEGASELWSYGADYSIEISEEGRFSSIKILHKSEVPDVNKILDFDKIIQILQTGDNERLAKIISPGIEIYYREKTLFFTKSLKNEIKNDSSKIFSTIKQISKGLESIDKNNPYMLEETMRIAEGQNPMHVIKVKTGHIIKEIVFDYQNGEYLIWEIKAN